MASCPHCHRPVAVARPRCLYCDTPLDPRTLPAGASAPPVEAPAEDRSLVVIAPGQSSAYDLGAALGLSAFEADQRLRRGGWHLHRIATPEAAEAEVASLRAGGVDALAIPEGETRTAQQPRVVAGGGPVEAGLLLRTEQGPLRLGSADVLLVVEGAIQRERQSEVLPRKTAWSAFPPAFRFQIHTWVDSRPLEIDPDTFSFQEPLLAHASSLLELRRWIAALGASTDEAFRFLPPALGLASSPVGAEVSQAFAADRAARRDGKAPPLLDNLAQFRAYSGWRGAVERRLRAG